MDVAGIEHSFLTPDLGYIHWEAYLPDAFDPMTFIARDDALNQPEQTSATAFRAGDSQFRPLASDLVKVVRHDDDLLSVRPLQR